MSHSFAIRGIDFELSSTCNAICSACSRRVHGKLTDFKQGYTSLSEVKRILDEDIVRGLLCIDMCGNFGDVMANPDIVDIVAWMRELNPTCDIRVKTNGSLGSPQQYGRLAELGVDIRFGIDGIGEKNELYRVNCKWSKIAENFKAFAEKNKKREHLAIQFLLWAETTDQILPMLDFAEQNEGGMLHFIFPSSNARGFVDVYNFSAVRTHSLTIFHKGNLKPIYDSIWHFSRFDELRKLLSTIDLTPKAVGLFDYNTDDVKQGVSVEKGILRPVFEAPPKAPEKYQTCFSKNAVEHSNLTENKYSVYITHEGVVLPCCFIGPAVSKALDGITTPELKKDMLARMEKIGVDRFSVKDKTLRQVIDSGVMHDFVYTDIEKGNAMDFCKVSCERCKN